MKRAAHSVVAAIQVEDPGYDPFAGSSVPVDVRRAATDRVFADGNYGPISQEDWLEQDGREPSTVADALRILAEVDKSITDYDPLDYDGDGLIDRDEIRRDVWSWVLDIYGRLPWGG